MYYESSSSSPFFQDHPRKLIPELLRQFYDLGWVTGTGGGISIRSGFVVLISLLNFCLLHQRFGMTVHKISSQSELAG